MREFVEHQRQASEYEAFLHQKVDTARALVRAGRGCPNDEVEAKFAERREGVESDHHDRDGKDDRETSLEPIWSKRSFQREQSSQPMW